MDIRNRTKVKYRYYTATFIKMLIVVNIALYYLEVDILKTRNSLEGHQWVLWGERVIAIIFTVEYLVRWYYSRNRSRYPFKFLAIVDLLSIIPFWIGFVLPAQWLGDVRALRVLRLIKLYRYHRGARVLMVALKHSVSHLKVIAEIVFVLVVMSSFLIYELEKEAQPDRFTSVWDGAWWTWISLTTVGYGDVYPVTAAGKVFAVFVTIVGTALVAAMFGIIISAWGRASEEIPMKKWYDKKVRQ
jgi:voltage-gated potassium channel